MKFLLPITLTLWSVAAPVFAGSPVVVELFTSQGCSSCPPADRMLLDLDTREDVIPLALHVDYWDYIGWEDRFADPAHSDRQRDYATIGRRRSVYTPQMIVNGVRSVVGARGMELAEAIQQAAQVDTGVAVTLEREGDRVRIAASSDAARAPMTICLIRYDPRQEVQITRGENAGHRLAYGNIVTEFHELTDWSGAEDLALSVAAPGDAPVVALVQEKGPGAILAAARLR